jgi:HEAT repeat protein
MPRGLSRWTLVVAAAVALSSCKGDPTQPDYWESQVKKARRTQEKVRVFDDLRAAGHANASFLPFLHQHLKEEKKPETRASVARLLGVVKDASSVQPLCDAVDLGGSDTDTAAMNKAIAQSLAAIGNPGAVPTLRRMLKAKDGIVQVEAISALGALRAKDAVAELIDKAKDDATEPFVIKKALQALGDIGDARAVPVLVQRMYQPHPKGHQFYGEASFSLFQVGQASAEALLPVLQGKGSPELMKWAKEADISQAALSSKAAQVLGDLHDKNSESALLMRLSEKGDDTQVFVRLTVSDALGKLRSTAAVKPLAGFIASEEPVEREKYGWALSRIGGRDAIAALTKAGAVGVWQARQPAILALALVGDDRDRAALEKLKTEEPDRTTKECGEVPELPGCRDPKTVAEKHAAEIGTYLKSIDAAKECGSDAGCWSKKLDDPAPIVRQRAALELGRANHAAHTAALLKKMADDNLEARIAAIQAVDWLIDGGGEAKKLALAHLPTIDQQIETEKGKTQYVRANEDLKRLAARLHREK